MKLGIFSPKSLVWHIEGLAKAEMKEIDNRGAAVAQW
jgi:hypothetical protein